MLKVNRLTQNKGKSQQRRVKKQGLKVNQSQGI
jgi:hypothetical protein